LPLAKLNQLNNHSTWTSMWVHISILKPTKSSEGNWLFKGATQGCLIVYASIIGHSENPYNGSAK
jgi:hypothetical protein